MSKKTSDGPIVDKTAPRTLAERIAIRNASSGRRIAAVRCLECPKATSCRGACDAAAVVASRTKGIRRIAEAWVPSIGSSG